MNETVKCLTIRQPWAWLIVNGHKNIENRSWSTNYRGPLVIQSSKGIGSIRELSETCNWVEHETGIALPGDFSLGTVEGIVTLSDVITTGTGFYADPGSFHWVLTNPKILTPSDIKGKLGIWNLSLKELTPETAVSIKGYIHHAKK